MGKKPWVINCPPGEVRTKQGFKAECDINKIVAKAFAGQPVQARASGYYGDVSEMQVDYQGAFAIVDRAQASFQALPAKVRERFHNNPAEFLAFFGDEANRAEAEELGLLPKKAVVAPGTPGAGVETKAPESTQMPPKEAGNGAPPVAAK